jgi:HK97 family phage major capsid protein
MVQTIKELLSTATGTEGSLLIEKKIYDTLIDPVVRTRVGRAHAAITVTDIPGSSVDIDTVDPKSMKVNKISEGAAVLMSSEAYSSFNMKPLKYGLRIAITKEMMEDGKWDLLAHNIEQAGLFMAYNEDKLLIADALDNATNTQGGGAALTISDITRAMQYLEDEDYTPDVMFVGATVCNDLRNIDTFVEANKLGSREMLENGMIGTIFGMKIVRFSTNSAPSTTYGLYAYIIDSKQAYVVAEKRPVTIEKYDDKIHDLEGAVVTQRVKYRQLRADAICRITTS